MRRRSFLALAASLALLPISRSVSGQTPVSGTSSTALMSLLRLLPDDPIGEMGIRYANYAIQRAALEIVEAGVDTDPDRWNGAMGAPLMTPSSMTVPLDPMWRAGLGFDLRDVDQMAEAGPSDASILLLTGRFDSATLTSAWEAGGYTPVETGGVTWHTLGGDNVLFDPDIPLSDWHLGMLSHLALLDRGTVVGTAKRADMERVLALHAGERRSFADGAGASFAAAPADLAVAWIVGGGTLVPVGDPLATLPNNPNVPADVQDRMATHAAEIAEEAPTMPPISLALVGATAGAMTPLISEAFPDAPAGRAVAVVVPGNEADGTLVAERVTERLTTLPVYGHELYMDRLYADIFPEIAVDVLPDGTVIIDLTPEDDVPAALLIDLLRRGQLSILYWGE